MTKYWYKIDFLEGEKTRVVVGASEYSPSQLVQQLRAGEFLLLNDLLYRDNQNRLQPFSRWDSLLPSTMYINPTYVVTVMPYDGDPRTGNPAQ